MREQLVTYKTAKLAKGLGFNWEVNHAYVNLEPYEDFLEVPTQYVHANNHNKMEHRTSVPTQSLLQKWLREKDKTHVIPHPIDDLSKWVAILDCETPTAFERVYNSVDQKLFYNSYEKALEKGLQEALNSIKNTKQ